MGLAGKIQNGRLPQLLAVPLGFISCLHSSHLKGHLGAPVNDITFFDQRRSLQAPVNDVLFFGPKEVSWVPPVNDGNVFGPKEVS